METISAIPGAQRRSAPAPVSDELQSHLLRMLALHFHPENGSPYWLKREREMGIDVLKSVKGIEDLYKLGPMSDESLRGIPVEEFVPRIFSSQKHRLILGDSAGSTGTPKVTAYAEEDFRCAFIDPFVHAAEAMRFPRGENWLFIGPSGPHIIGKAARACAGRLESMDPFMVDFDPRWARKMKPGSMGHTRYLDHVIHQAMDILLTQDIGVLFATPSVLIALGERMSREQCLRILGVHYGGVALTPGLYDGFRNEMFPNAVHLSGYGNSLFGMCPELFPVEPRRIDYYPHGNRAVIRLIPIQDGDEPDCDPSAADLAGSPGYGERGRIMFHRLDASALIVNMCERDSAERIPPPEGFAEMGFVQDGFRFPDPLPHLKKQLKTGLY